MIKSFLVGGSLAFLLFGLFNMLTGNSAAGVCYLVAGSIMDLQARSLNLSERLFALENKENKDGNESSQGS